MLLTNHYPSSPLAASSTTANEAVIARRRPSLDPSSRALYPLSSFRHHPYSPNERLSSSNSNDNIINNSRRRTSVPVSSIVSPKLEKQHRSPPMLPPPTISPNESRATLTGPWRRDSLPSISHLTRVSGTFEETQSPQQHRSPLQWQQQQQQLSDWQTDHDTGSPDAMRRHSIAIPTRYQQHLNKLVLDDDNDSAANKLTAYSRSPELRVSHKIAERKRRKEMNDLFDELRDILPVEKSLKTSKWEILSKALEYIATLQERESRWSQEKNELCRELASMRPPSSC